MVLEDKNGLIIKTDGGEAGGIGAISRGEVILGDGRAEPVETYSGRSSSFV